MHTQVVNRLLQHFWDGLTGKEKVVAGAPEPPPERRASVRQKAAIDVSLRWALVDGEWKIEDAKVVDVSRFGFAIEAADPPEAGQSIWLHRAQAPAIRATVKRVEPRESGFLVALEVIQREKRRYERQPADGGAEARWVGIGGVPQHCSCRVVNLSDAGMQVLMDQPPPEGSYVRIIGRQVECSGSLRYCRSQGDDGPFLIGLQFLECRSEQMSPELMFAKSALASLETDPPH